MRRDPYLGLDHAPRPADPGFGGARHRDAGADRQGQGFSTLERAAGRPTCDVHGIWGGHQGPGEKTVLPAVVGAKLSFRLVPDQDPHRIAGLFRQFALALSLPGIELEIRQLAHAKPWRLDAEGPIVEAAMAAMEDVWGKRPLRAPSGGSLPVLTTFSEVLSVPVLLLGFGLADDRPHSPNEKLDLPQFYGGIRSSVRVLDRLGELGKSPSGGWCLLPQRG